MARTKEEATEGTARPTRASRTSTSRASPSAVGTVAGAVAKPGGRGRGRPPKANKPEIVRTPGARPRGRPKGTFKRFNDDGTPVTPKVKVPGRGRGRPRKSDAAGTTPKAATPKTATPGTGRRGRPRKGSKKEEEPVEGEEDVAVDEDKEEDILDAEG